MSFGMITSNESRQKAKLCYMNTNSFIDCITTYDVYLDIAKDVKTRFDTSNCEIERPLPKGNNKNVIGLIKE